MSLPVRGFLTRNGVKARMQDVWHACVPFDVMGSLTAQIMDSPKRIRRGDIPGIGAICRMLVVGFIL